MDKRELIAKLNWFYSLELNQVDLYNAQSKTFKGRYSGIVFERLTYIEQQHVDNIEAKIKSLGGKPTVLGDILSPIIGHLAGDLIALNGLEDALTANILLEQKAMKDYNDLIEKLHRENYGDADLIKLLQHNFVDEHLHTEWFRTKILALKQYEYSAKHFTPYTTVGSDTDKDELAVATKINNRRRTRPIKPRRTVKSLKKTNSA